VARARRPLIRSSVPPASDLYSLHANTGWHRCACGQRVQPAAKTPATCGEISRRARFHIGLAAAQREAARGRRRNLELAGNREFPHQSPFVCRSMRYLSAARSALDPKDAIPSRARALVLGSV